MGFYIRKSFKIGPIRLNLSKSGIGVSSGVRGARISTGPRGTYVNVGRGGIYYRQKIGGFGSVPSNAKQNPFATPPPVQESREPADSSDNLIQTTHSELISQINSRIREPSYAWVVGVAATVISAIMVFVGFMLESATASLVRNPPFSILFLSLILATGVWIVGMWVAWVTKQQDQFSRITTLEYELDGDKEQAFIAIQKAIEALSQAGSIWRVTSETTTWDWKRHAGATSVLTRIPVAAGHMRPSYIYTKLKVFGLALDIGRLYFLPDQILVFQNQTYSSVGYSDCRVSLSQTRFIEEGRVPSDCEIAEYTWRYKRKDGGPDMRFSNNKKIPIVLYAEVGFSSLNGLNFNLQVSNLPYARQFVHALSEYVNYREGNAASSAKSASSKNFKEKSHPQNHVSTNQGGDSPYTVLNIPTTATFEEINIAYRNMAQMYHPDKVASLAPEYQEIAEKRMQVINAAYQVLKDRFGKS